MLKLKSIILMLFLIFNVYSFYSDDKEDETIEFKFGIIRKDENEKFNRTLLGENKNIKSSDSIKIYINPIKNSYIYLYLLDSSNSLKLLFPENIEFFDKKYKTGQNYAVPDAEKEWFTFDENKGVEKFILLVSIKRLKALEALTNKFLKTEDKKDKIDKNDKDGNINLNRELLAVQQNILDEIIRIKMENSDFIVIAEKPVAISGSARGMGILNEIKELIYRIEAKKFYTKSIELEH